MLFDRMCAERNFARSLGRLQAEARLKPLPLVVDQADQGHRHAANLGSEGDDILELFLRCGVENLIPVECVQAAQLRLFATGNVFRCVKADGISQGIISANTNEIDDGVKNAGAVGVFDKNDEQAEGNYYDRALVWLADQWEMMEILSAARKEMEASAADVFLLRLWPRWKIIAGLESDKTELAKIVTRQYVNHMADLLGLDDPANASWHPFENYVSPALMANRAHTGDIFKFDGKLWVVLTPQCDMATQKVDNAILAQCVSGIANWAEMVAAYKAQASASSIDKSTKFLRRLVNQNVEPSQHFLPPLPGEVEPLMVHFSSVMTMPLGDLNAAIEQREASIASPFLSNIVQRFGAYISRTGQPNIDIGRLS